MKKTFLILTVLAIGVMSYSQTPGPHADNVDVGIFNNGANGSNAGSGAFVEISLKIKSGGVTYTASPAADQWVVYVMAPVTSFATTDVVTIVQANAALYGSGAPTVMLPQGLTDIGDPGFYYLPIVLNIPSMNLSPLGTSAWTYAFTLKIQTDVLVDRTVAEHNSLKIVDQTNNTFLTAANGGTPTFTHLDVLTQNNLTVAAFTVLPVRLLNLSGYKDGAKNTLHWTTASEENNLGFEVQRSADGNNYSAIGFVNSKAPGGSSSSLLNYTFDDNGPVGKKQYYRLKQKDFDGNNKLSSIVMITGDKATVLGIGGIFPNPASTQVNVIIDAPQRDKVTLMITDMAGKTVKQQQENVGIGSNTVAVDIAKLAVGSYLVKLICQSSECESAVGKFNKQ